MSDIDTTIVFLTWSPTQRRMRVMMKSLESLKECTHIPHHLIIVDNGPPEQTEWLREHARGTIITNKINQGIAKGRNAGAALVTTKYVAFVDNDLKYFDGWLGQCIGALETYPDRKLIAVPLRSSPMNFEKYYGGLLDGYQLWRRASGMCLVMRKSSIDEIGGWDESHYNVGGSFVDRVKRAGYLFLWNPEWDARHIARRSYHYKHQVFDPATGSWNPLSALQKQESRAWI